MLRLALCLVLVASVFAIPEVNLKFSDEELQRYFGVDSQDKAPEYEIVYPQFVTAEGKRSVGRSAIAASFLEIQVDAFGELLHMSLEHDDSGFEPGLEAEYVTDEGIIKVPVRTDCIYTGKVNGESNSMVTVSTCAGLMAIMNHASGPTYIEPLDDEHALKRDIGRGLPHVAYKSKPDDGARCPVTRDSVYAQFRNEGKQEVEDVFLDPESTKYMELAFIGDAVLYDLRGSNTANCLAMLFKAVKNVLQLSSLSVTNQLVVKCVYIKVFTSAESGLNTCPDSDQGLEAARAWQASNNFAASDRRHWDNAAILTGWVLDSGDTLGIALLGNCDNAYAVSYSTFRTLDSTDTVAHEIGHNLNMEHDSDGNCCDGSRYIMAASSTDHRAEPIWSACSRTYYDCFVASRSCYNDP